MNLVYILTKGPFTTRTWYIQVCLECFSVAQLISLRKGHPSRSPSWFIRVCSGTNSGRDLATFTDVLKLFLALDSEIPFLGIYAEGIITEICYNE